MSGDGDAGRHFAPAARRLAGAAGVVFGWRPVEFWTATPAELATLIAATGTQADETSPPDAARIAQLQEQFPDG